MLRQPQLSAIIFGVLFGLVLFLVGGRASMDAVNVVSAGFFGGLAGVGMRYGLSIRPPISN